MVEERKKVGKQTVKELSRRTRVQELALCQKILMELFYATFEYFITE
jgi:hypothetical protein